MSDAQAPLKKWLESELSTRTHGVRKDLAKALGFPRSDKIPRMLPDAKEPRRIQPHEIEIMARFFQSLPPGYEQMTQWLDRGSTPSQERAAHFSETIRETRDSEYNRPLQAREVAEPIHGEKAIRSALGRIVGLSPKNIDQLFSEIADMIGANVVGSTQRKSRGQSEQSNPHRESTPSE